MVVPEAARHDGEYAAFGVDVQKLITNRLSFVDSKADVLIQSVDVLCSFLRRALNGTITDPGVIASLGRLQIKRRDRGALQSLGLLAFAQELPAAPQLASTVRAMTIVGRPMIVPNRLKMMEDAQTAGEWPELSAMRKPIPMRKEDGSL
jgi:hypothetical protein